MADNDSDLWAIVCDARAQNDAVSVLALVDRGKSKAMWWTSDDTDLIMAYRSKAAADFACRRLKKNWPRVVPYSTALADIQLQARELEHMQAMECMESGWDGHKSC